MQPTEEPNRNEPRTEHPPAFKGRVRFSIQQFLDVARKVANATGQLIATCFRHPNEPGAAAIPHKNAPLDIAISEGAQILHVTGPDGAAVSPSISELRVARETVLQKTSAAAPPPKFIPEGITEEQVLQGCLEQARGLLAVNVAERAAAVPGLSGDEQAVLGVLAARFVHSEVPYLVKKDIRNVTLRSSGGFFESKELTVVLNSLVEKGLVTAGNDQLNYPALLTYRITLAALDKLELHPNYKPPEGLFDDRPGKSEMAAALTQEEILPAVLNTDMDSYGAVYNQDRVPAGFCETLAIVTANVNALVAAPDGRLHVLGFPWARQRSQEAPVCITLSDSSAEVYLLTGADTAQFEYTQTADCSLGILRRFGAALLLDFRAKDGPHVTRLSKNVLPANVDNVHPLNDGSIVCSLQSVGHLGSQPFLDPAAPSLVLGRYQGGEFELLERFDAEVLSAILPKGGGDFDEWPSHINAVFGDQERALIVLSGRNVLPPETAIPGALLLKEGSKFRLLAGINHGFMSSSVFSSNGEYLATISGDYTERGITLTHIAPNGECRSQVLPLAGREYPCAFAFSPDCKLLGATISSTGDGGDGTQVRIWNIEDAANVREVLSFTRDTESFPGPCVFRSDHAFVFLDSVIGAEYSRAEGTYVNEVRLGRQYADDRNSSAVSDGLLHELLLSEGDPDHTFPVSGALRVPEDLIFSHQLASPATETVQSLDRGQVLYGCEDGTIGIISREPDFGSSSDNEIITKLSDSIRSLKLSPDGTRILAITSGGACVLIYLASEESTQSRAGSGSVATLVRPVVDLTNRNLDIEFADFGPDGETVVLAGNRTESRVLPNERSDEQTESDAFADELLSRLTSRHKVRIEIHDPTRLAANESLVDSREFNADAYFWGGSLSPDRRCLTYSTNGGTLNMVRLFDETAGGAVPAIKRLWASKDEAAASHVSFNQAGDLLVLDGAVYRLDTTSDFRPEREINITFGRSVLQSIDGSGDLIALSRTEHGSQQSIVRVIAWKDKDRFGRPRIVAEWKSNSTVLSIALGSDGRELVCTSKDGAVRIFGRESES